MNRPYTRGTRSVGGIAWALDDMRGRLLRFPASQRHRQGRRRAHSRVLQHSRMSAASRATGRSRRRPLPAPGRPRDKCGAGGDCCSLPRMAGRGRREDVPEEVGSYQRLCRACRLPATGCCYEPGRTILERNRTAPSTRCLSVRSWFNPNVPASPWVASLNTRKSFITSSTSVSTKSRMLS